MAQYHKIPKERIGVLIGPEGAVKVELERRSGTRLDVDSETGEVTVLTEEAKDPVMALKASDVVKAIGRGFPPEMAMKLFRDDTYYESVDIHEFTGKSPKRVMTVKGRLIGTGGKTRRLLEEHTSTSIRIYGDTVGILGDYRSVMVAKEAVEMLLSGSEHGAVYAFLERKRRERRLERMTALETEKKEEE